MTAEIIGVIIGIAFIVPTIYFIRTKEWDSIAWPMFLVSLPVYYMLFGLLALDGKAILMELLYGLPYVLTGLLVWRMKSRLSLAIIGIAWLSHGFYDYFHDVLFVNPGVFAWYPAFCAIIDIVVGIYLLLAAARILKWHAD